MTEPASRTKPGDEKEEKEEGISKYVKRMRTVLKGARSNRASISSMGEMLGEPSRSGTKPTSASGTTKPKAVAPDNAPEKASESVPKKTPTTVDPVQVQHWNNLQREKARALFAKYGLTLDPGEWMIKPTNANIQRVEKPVRMRVRRNCHRCLAAFGASVTCPHCQHPRCKKCIRYPPTKSAEDKGKGKEKAVTPTPAPKATPKPSKMVLSIPSRTGGQDRVRRPIKMRVRRSCHRCSALFDGDATVCEKCSHIRCKKCPRSPPKLDKWPDGYPGDAEPVVEPQQRVWRKPRRRVRWTCHTCNQAYSLGGKICAECNHERCKDCIRDPPKKIKPEPDPDVLRAVEAKLAALEV